MLRQVRLDVVYLRIQGARSGMMFEKTSVMDYDGFQFIYAVLVPLVPLYVIARGVLSCLQ